MIKLTNVIFLDINQIKNLQQNVEKSDQEANAYQLVLPKIFEAWIFIILYTSFIKFTNNVSLNH